MKQDIQSLKPELEQQVSAALSRMSMSNRGTFPPFRIPAAARSLVAALLDQMDDRGTQAAQPLGQGLGRQGLGLLALLEAHTAVIRAVAGAFGGAAQPVGFVSRYFNQLIDSFVTAEQAE